MTTETFLTSPSADVFAYFHKIGRKTDSTTPTPKYVYRLWFNGAWFEKRNKKSIWNGIGHLQTALNDKYYGLPDLRKVHPHIKTLGDLLLWLNMHKFAAVVEVNPVTGAMSDVTNKIGKTRRQNCGKYPPFDPKNYRTFP